MRKNMVQPDRPRWQYMVYTCWITHTPMHASTAMHTHTHTHTHMHSEYLMLIIFPLQQWSRKCSSLLHLHIHCLSSCSLYTNSKITFKDQDSVDDSTLSVSYIFNLIHQLFPHYKSWNMVPDIQGVPGGMCQILGECSLGQTIPI